MRQYWIAPIPPFHIADGAAYNTSTTLTDVGPTPSIVLPANFLETGMRLEFGAFGRYSTTTGPPNLTLGIYIGSGAITSGMSLANTGAVATIASVTNTSWRLEGNASIRSVGSGTAATALGMLEVSGITSVSDSRLAPASAPAVLAFDSTIANKVMIGATWGTSSASNTLTVHYFGVRVVN